MNDAVPTPGDAARDLAADLALCDAATPGPWHVAGRCAVDAVADTEPGVDHPYRVARTWASPFAPPPEEAAANADFIAAAREGWPAALRRLAALEAELAALKAERGAGG